MKLTISFKICYDLCDWNYFETRTMTTNILALIITFFAMEFVAWFTHKYVMHGLLWVLHKDHHQTEPGIFEKNDSFFLIFAIPSMILIMLGVLNNFDIKVYIGFGIALYGLAYFLVHDIFIHQRIKIFRRSNCSSVKSTEPGFSVVKRKSAFSSISFENSAYSSDKRW